MTAATTNEQCDQHAEVQQTLAAAQQEALGALREIAKGDEYPAAERVAAAGLILTVGAQGL